MVLAGVKKMTFKEQSISISLYLSQLGLSLHSVILHWINRVMDGYTVASRQLLTVNHLRQFLQQVVLSDAGVHVVLQVVTRELVDEIVKVVHG